MSLVDGAMQRGEEPSEPLGDIQRLLLGALQDVVVGLALALDLRRKAVEALGATIRAGQEQVADGTRDAAISIIKRVQGNEPQVGDPALTSGGSSDALLAQTKKRSVSVSRW